MIHISAEKLSFETLKKETDTFTIVRPNFSETTYKFPEELSQGEVRFIQLQEELGINIVNQKTLAEKVIDRPDGPADLLQFAFYLSGDNVKAQTEGMKSEIIVSGGDSLILPPIVPGKIEIPANQHFNVIIILINPSLLYPFIEEDGTQMPSDFLKLIEGSYRDPFIHQVIITPAMQISLHQILNCPYQGALKYIYLEAKALELVALRLELLLLDKKPLDQPSLLQSADIDRIHHAKKILADNMENPPSLSDLA